MSRGRFTRAACAFFASLPHQPNCPCYDDLLQALHSARKNAPYGLGSRHAKKGVPTAHARLNFAINYIQAARFEMDVLSHEKVVSVLEHEFPGRDVHTALARSVASARRYPRPPILSPAGWLLQNTRRRLKRPSKRSRTGLSLGEFLDLRVGNHSFSFLEFQEVWDKLIAYLDEEERYLLDLRAVRKLPYWRIAALLGILEEAARKRWERLRKKCRSWLENNGHGPA